MRKLDRAFVFVLAAVVCLAIGLAASSQTTRQPPRPPKPAAVTPSDIQRLEETVNDVNRSIDRLRSSDSALATRLQDRLDDVRDEVTYLKVKLRKEGTVSRDEVTDTRDRLEQLRAQAVGEIPGAYESQTRGTTGANRDVPAQQSRGARPNEVPEGTELDVRLRTSLNSGTAQVEDPFEATTVVDLMSGDKVLVPAGSAVRGVVASVDKAGRIERKGRLTLKFDQMSIEHRNYPIQATVTQALEGGGYRGDAVKIGAGAGVGAIIGGILGGAKGALAGILIGGGGVVAATEGQDVDLPAGTVLRVRFDDPIVVR